MKNKLWSLILLSSSVTASEAPQEGLCDFLNKLSPYQQDVAEMAYRAGEAHNLGLTAVAVAWQESRLGLYKVRMNTHFGDQSFGVFHSVSKWKTKGMTAFERGRWVEKVVTNDVISIDIGVKDLVYWQGRAKGNWKRGVEMYNAGIGSNSVYVKDVVNTVNKLKGCF